MAKVLCEGAERLKGFKLTGAPWRPCAQIYNQIYNATYSAFRQGTSPPPLNYSSPVLSHAVIPSLAFSTRYYYQVSNSAGACTGPVYNFTSPPGAPQPLCSHLLISSMDMRLCVGSLSM